METGTSALMFCTDASMDSIIGTSPTTSSACSTPTQTQFLLQSQQLNQGGVVTTSVPVQCSTSGNVAESVPGPAPTRQVAVIYSHDYTAQNSFDELFALEKRQKPMRSRNLPGNFFDQASASSSTSHSRDSIDSAAFNSPQRNSMVPPMGQTGADNGAGFSAHLSLKRTPSKAKTGMDSLAAFDSKTRSLPCSFSPSKFANPNSAFHLPNNSSNLNSVSGAHNLNNNENNKVQLESFSTLQRGIQQSNQIQNRLKTTDVCGLKQQPLSTAFTTTTSTAASNQQPQHQQQHLFTSVNPNMLYSLQQQQIGVQQQQQPAFYQQLHNAALISQQIQLGGNVPVSQQVLNSPTQLVQMQAVYGCLPQQQVNQNMSNQSNHHNHHPKEETFFHLQQLENERNNMKKRQLELMQAKLIGPNSANRATVEAMQQANNGFNQLQQQHQQQQQYNCFTQQQLNQLQSVGSSKPQSRQESVDSGLDLVGYSSSSESTNRVSPELYLQMNNSNLVANSSHHQLQQLQQQQQQQFTCGQFVSAGAVLNQKLLANPQTTPTTTSTGGCLFGGTVVSSNGDMVAQEVSGADNGSGNRFVYSTSSSNGKPMSSTVSVDGSAYLNCFNTAGNAGSLLDEYNDSMSIASSPTSTLDGNVSCHSSSTTPTNLPTSTSTSISSGRPPMVPQGALPATTATEESATIQQSANIYDDNFLNNLLNGTEQDLFDFNGNFSLPGNGVISTGGIDDFQAGFSYNL